MLDRSKLNSIKTLKHYLIVKFVIKSLLQLLMTDKISRIKKNCQNNEQSKNNTEKINLIEEGKKIGIDEVIKDNEIINKSFKAQL